MVKGKMRPKKWENKVLRDEIFSNLEQILTFFYTRQVTFDN